MSAVPKLVTDIRRHRRGAGLTPELASHMSNMIRCWQMDPTAKGVSFNDWCASFSTTEIRMKPVVAATARAVQLNIERNFREKVVAP